jgi:mono/diheme cytochrome c family protein
MLRRLLSAALAMFTIIAPVARSDEAPASREQIARGRYMVLVGHCNNCHTAGYIPAAGNVPEQLWLMGNPVGRRGKTGTSYAINLRLYFAGLSEEGWLKVARSVRTRAPMPWWSLRDTSDDDLRAIYHYVRSLSPLGSPAPAFLPPEREPPRPYNQLPDLS